jgi:hypothetical protein
MTRTDHRSQEVERAVRNLLATESGSSTSTEVAIRATQACEQLVRHLSRLLGGTGSRTLLKRSVHLASASFPWLARAEIPDGAEGGATLRTRMESESPGEATEAFVCLLTTFFELLARLIGEVLAARVLHEVWPAMFPSDVKETMLGKLLTDYEGILTGNPRRISRTEAGEAF